MDKSLLAKLASYAEEDYLPMHMPGHKRCDGFPYPAPLPFKFDITEIDGFDDLNHPEGIFLESQRLAASLWGSDECIYSVNGSSGAILAGIRGSLAGKKSKKVLMARGCHKSVYHGVELCGAVPVYLSAEVDPFGFHTEISPKEVKRKLSENPDTSLVIITSPTYEGIISDVREIARICHDAGVPLMVDEAHGAHLSLHGVFPEGAVSCGADIVVQSIHKTLPSLTQTALMHLSGELIDKVEIKRQMSIFQTTSPSYILSSSIDCAVRYLASEKGKKRLEDWHLSVIGARERLTELKNLTLFESPCYDVSKLVICGAGAKLADYLRREHKIELEMSSLSYVIGMTGAGDGAESLDRFVQGVFEADKIFTDVRPVAAQDLSVPRQIISPAEAVELECEEISLSDALGRISASYVYAYPPGIPMIVPGELCDESFISSVSTAAEKNVSLRGISNGKIRVIKE